MTRSVLFALLAALVAVPALADETCQSPYLAKLEGQEDYVYVWTLGVEGLGDGSDKLVTIGANPARDGLRQGGRTRSRSAAATRRTTAASPTTAASSGLGGLDTSAIFIFDVATRSRPPEAREDDRRLRPKAPAAWSVRTRFFALPGRMLISGALERRPTTAARPALVEYNERRASSSARSGCPTTRRYGYDVRVNARLNRMLTSSFTGHKNYMRKLAELMGDAEAMKKFGNTVVVWDFHARKPLQTLEGARRAARDPLGAGARATTTPSSSAALTGEALGRVPQGRRQRSRR